MAYKYHYQELQYHPSPTSTSSCPCGGNVDQLTWSTPASEVCEFRICTNKSPVQITTYFFYKDLMAQIIYYFFHKTLVEIFCKDLKKSESGTSLKMGLCLEKHLFWWTFAQNLRVVCQQSSFRLRGSTPLDTHKTRRKEKRKRRRKKSKTTVCLLK